MVADDDEPERVWKDLETAIKELGLDGWQPAEPPGIIGPSTIEGLDKQLPVMQAQAECAVMAAAGQDSRYCGVDTEVEIFVVDLYNHQRIAKPFTINRLVGKFVILGTVECKTIFAILAPRFGEHRWRLTGTDGH
jgi:hypothetical protein